MEKPFKFRRVREIAGAFVLVAIALLVAGVVMHGKVRGWFEPKMTFVVRLPDSGTQGVKAGSDVYVLGSKAGTVKRVELRHQETGKTLTRYAEVPPELIQLVAILEVRGGMMVFVSPESKAVLKRGLGGFGSSFFEITRGHKTLEHEEWASGEHWLEFSEEQDMKKEATEIMEEIRVAIVPALKKIMSASSAIETMASSMSDGEGELQQSLKGLNSLVGKIDRGEGMLGVLMNDDKARADLQESMANFKTASADLSESLEGINSLVTGIDEGKGAVGRLVKDEKTATQINKTIANIESSSAALNEVLASFKNSSDEFPDVIDNWNRGVGEFEKAAKILQEALREYELIAEGFQRSWLIRGSVNKVKAEKEKAKRRESAPRPAPQAESKASEPKKRKGIPPFFKRR